MGYPRHGHDRRGLRKRSLRERERREGEGNGASAIKWAQMICERQTAAHTCSTLLLLLFVPLLRDSAALSPCRDVKLQAIGSRSEESAHKFAKLFGYGH